MKTKTTLIVKKQSVFSNRTKQNYSICMGIYGMIAFFTFFAQIMSMKFFINLNKDDIFYVIRNYSNLVCLLMMFNSIMMCIACSIAKKKNNPYIPKPCSIINFATTAAISLSMFVTVFILAPVYAINKNPEQTAASLYEYANIFFNFIIPVLSIIAFVCYAKQKPMKVVEILYALIPLAAYFTFYLVAAYTHTKPEGGFQEGYDWYSLCKFGPWGVVGFSFAIYGVYFGILLALRQFNMRVDVGSMFIKIFATCFALLLVLFGIIIIPDEEPWEAFKWFTNLSNWVYGVAAIVTLVYLCLIYKHKVKVMPAWADRFKLCGVTAVGLTAIIVICGFMPTLLGRGETGQIYGLFQHRNLYYHAVVPFMAIGSYIALEHTDLKFRNVLYTIIAPFLYLIAYTVVAYVFADSDLSYKYHDWYYLYSALGPKFSWVIPFAGAAIILLFGYIVWLCNRKIIIDYEPLIAIKQPYFAKVKINKSNKNLSYTKKIKIESEKVKEKRTAKNKAIIAICLGCGLPIIVGALILGLTFATK